MGMRHAGGLALTLLGAALALGACEAGASTAGEGRPAFKTAALRGTVSYRERIALQPGATVHVQLLELPKDGAPLVVSEQTVITDRQPPIDFLLTYDPDAIRADARYGLSATITTGGVTMWSTPAPMSIVPSAVGGAQSVLVVRMRADVQPGQ